MTRNKLLLAIASLLVFAGVEWFVTKPSSDSELVPGPSIALQDSVSPVQDAPEVAFSTNSDTSAF